MKHIELKVTRIGNSRGVRIPAATLERYQIADTVIMEERSDGILLRPMGRAVAKLSWDETAREMAVEAEDWSAWNAVDADGLDVLPWSSAPSARVAEPGPKSRSSRRGGKR